MADKAGDKQALRVAGTQYSAQYATDGGACRSCARQSAEPKTPLFTQGQAGLRRETGGTVLQPGPPLSCAALFQIVGSG